VGSKVNVPETFSGAVILIDFYQVYKLKLCTREHKLYELPSFLAMKVKGQGQKLPKFNLS